MAASYTYHITGNVGCLRAFSKALDDNRILFTSWGNGRHNNLEVDTIETAAEYNTIMGVLSKCVREYQMTVEKL